MRTYAREWDEPDCLFLLSSTLINIIHVTSWSYDNLLNLKSLLAFCDRNPSVFFVFCMYGNSNKKHWLFFRGGIVYIISSKNYFSSISMSYLVLTIYNEIHQIYDKGKLKGREMIKLLISYLEFLLIFHGHRMEW